MPQGVCFLRQSDQNSTGTLIPSLMLALIHWLYGGGNSIHADVTQCERLLTQRLEAKAVVVGLWKTQEV